MSKLKKKDYFRIALYVILIIVVLGFFRNTLRKGMNDFEVVHRAATRVLNTENLYNFDDGHYLYKYSPVFAIVVAPLGLFSLSSAQIIWLAGMCICLFFIMRWSKKMIMGDKPPPPYLYILTILFTSKFLVREIRLGQTDLLMLLFIFLFFLSTGGGKELKAGLFLALSLMIKPTSLIFVPYLLYKKKFRLIGYMAITCIVFLFIPSLVYSFWGNLNLLSGWKTVMSASSPPLLAVDLNQSLFAFFYRFATPTTYQVNFFNLNHSTVNLLIYATAVGLFIFLLFLNHKSKFVEGNFVKHPECIEYSLLLIFLALFSPLGWFQNYSSSILAYMLLLYYVLRTGLKDRFVFILLTLSFLLVNAINFETVGRRVNDLSLYLSFITFGIFLVIICLSKLRLSKIA
ncbi:MAG: hypothetical protein AMJ91_03160 [candidate division Zixibacteria bacterium SM23_73_3]|nr:MAG: hypothetical protein AMJ91_03160 [candidate division Zixibacteria bacterium SM23_73_3]